MKYKKLVIILASIIGFIALCFLLSFTLFRVSAVELNFKNGTTLFASEERQKAVIKSGDFSYSTPVFGVNKAEIIDKLELENSYLKVINIETVFPNKLVVHCAEREELFAIKIGDNLYYICDADLKVLRMDTQVVLDQTSAVVLENVEVVDKTVKVGEKLKLLTDENYVKDIPNAFAFNNKTIADIKGMFKSISIEYQINYYTLTSAPVFTFTTFDGFKIKVGLPSSFFIEKINTMLTLIPLSTEYYKTHCLVLEINPNNIHDTYFRYIKN